MSFVSRREQEEGCGHKQSRCGENEIAEVLEMLEPDGTPGIGDTIDMEINGVG